MFGTTTGCANITSETPLHAEHFPIVVPQSFCWLMAEFQPLAKESSFNTLWNCGD
jgi:hypothetical protein